MSPKTIKRINVLFLLFLLSLNAQAQKKDNLETLDEFFAGVPLKNDFSKWYYYIKNHSYLGIDSTGKRGHYSSFKPGIQSHSPFPDSIPVKLLFKKTVFRDSLSSNDFDSTLLIMIEGIFAGDKSGRKLSEKVFNQLRKKLRSHYKQAVNYVDFSGYWFKRGKSTAFPDCSIWQGYEPDKKFYYVLISYDFPSRKVNPWYLELVP
jgi:hypothetical protein